MSLKLRKVDVPTGAAAPPGAPDEVVSPAFVSAPSIAGWLGVFATMLPRRQAESIREELETHLRDRVRDLMVGGLNEAESTKRAIAELGEAAELAGKYRAVTNEPRRRIVMYGTVFMAAGAALAVGIAAISGRQPEAELAKAKAESEAVKNLLVDTLVRVQPEWDTRLLLDLETRRMQQPDVDPSLLALSRVGVGQAMRLQGATFEAQPGAPELGTFKADVKFEETPASDVLQIVEKFAGMPVQANWPQLAEAGLDRETKVTLRAKEAGADVILRALNEAAGHVREAKIDWRATNGVIEVDVRDRFDRREVRLVIYDLDGIIAARREKYGEEREKIVEEVASLVTEFVSPTGWQENGGDLAKKTVVGDRMFVEAPERFHKQIRWMLDQLPGEKPRKQGNAGEGAEGLDVQRYVIQHIAAQDALKALRTNQAIKAIDFSNFVADERTNSVLGKVSPEQHAMVRAVLGQIDTEEAAFKERKRADNRQQLDEREARLRVIQATRTDIERRLLAPDADEACLESLRKDLRSLNEQEALLRLEVQQIKTDVSARPGAKQIKAQLSSRGDARGAGHQTDTVYLTGSVTCPGVYAITEGLTLRRLMAAAGGLPPAATEVVISESADGKAKVTQTIPAAELKAAEGPDPVIKSGQLVSVR